MQNVLKRKKGFQGILNFSYPIFLGVRKKIVVRGGQKVADLSATIRCKFFTTYLREAAKKVLLIMAGPGGR